MRLQWGARVRTPLGLSGGGLRVVARPEGAAVLVELSKGEQGQPGVD